MVRCSAKECKGKAVTTLHYGNLSYCKKHFLEFFEGRTKRLMRDYELVKKGDRIGLALSGGKDSVALLHFLSPICKEMRVPLFAILVDEGIEGYRNKSIGVAEKNCKKLGIPLVIRSFKKELGITIDEIAKKRKREKICSYCGVFRRWVLNKAARELGLNKLATAHNLDDTAQTVLMNFMRNEPFRLARYGPVGGIVEDEMFINRIKPFFKIPEKESALYCMLKDLGIVFQPCPYASEAFRGSVRDFLNNVEEEYPGTKIRIANSFLAIKGALEKKYAKLGNPIKCVECGEPSSEKICKRCAMVKEIVQKE